MQSNQVNAVTPFSFGENQVRVISIDGQPWFVAKDICDVLGLGNPTRACSGLDQDELNTLTLSKGIRGNPLTVIVSESGMYALILRSRKPQAKAFRRWVTGTVLVSIRETGRFEAAPVSAPVPTPVRQMAPQRDLKDWIDCMEVMGLTADPLLKSLVSQRMAEQLGGLTLPQVRQVVLTVRAQDLGVSQSAIGNGSQLGKYIVSCGFVPTGKSYHGKYHVNCYELTEDLDRAILEFFAPDPA